MRHCAKCEWLGLMGPCPHEGEPFPIFTRSRRATKRYIPDVAEFIERSQDLSLTSENEDAEDFDPEAEDAPNFDS